MTRMVGLGLLVSLGIISGSIAVAKADTQDHAMPGHGHQMLNVPPGQPIPTLSLDISPDRFQKPMKITTICENLFCSCFN